jgi:hypothetical protein
LSAGADAGKIKNAPMANPAVKATPLQLQSLPLDQFV